MGGGGRERFKGKNDRIRERVSKTKVEVGEVIENKRHEGDLWGEKKRAPIANERDESNIDSQASEKESANKRLEEGAGTEEEMLKR